jgi:septal ring factor EnvC (AmiA/AmiB activator)
MKKQKKNIFFLLMRGAVCALFFLAFAGSMPVHAAEDAGDIESDISKIEKKLKQETQELNVLKQDLNQINSTLTSTQQLILKVQNLLSQTEQTIGQKEGEIANLEKQLTLERHVLRGLIQEMYFTGDIPLAGIVLGENDLLGLIQGNDSLFSTQEKMQEVIRGIHEMRVKVSDEKVALEDTKADHAALLAIKNRQKQALVSEK